MNSKKFLLGAVLIFLMAFSFVSSPEAKMIKEVAMGLFLDAPTLEEGTLFYLNQHGPEVLRCSGPWMTRYQAWLPYEPPEEAVKLFGAVRGRYGELWFHEQDYLERGELKGASKPPWIAEKRSVSENKQTNVMIPCLPTEEFYDSDPYPATTPILRWVTVMAYPEGVSVEDGEKWFLNVYAKEAVKQPGLLKFVSYRVWENPNESGSPPSGDKTAQSGQKTPNMTDSKASQKGEKSPEMTGMPKMTHWVRVCEYWYNDFAAWRKAVLESPPKYTAPSWGGKYPFVQMVSTFLPYSPDIDFMKGTYTPSANKPMTNYTTIQSRQGE
jgi:hypothetical protein